MLFHVFTSMSLDGFIGDRDKNPPWNHGFHPDDFGYKNFIEQIDLIVIGRTTFDQVRGFEKWPWKDKKVQVLTSRLLNNDVPEGVSGWYESAEKLVAQLRSQNHPDHVWIMGGPRLIKSFLDLDALNHLHICLLPILLGGGSRLIEPLASVKMLRLIRHENNKDGSFKLVYSLPEPK